MVSPDYPAAAGGDSVAVVLDVLIGRDGRPEVVEVFEGEEPFAEAAVAAGERYTFHPAIGGDDEPVRTWVELVVPVAPPVLSASGGGDAVVMEEVGERASQDTVSEYAEPPEEPVDLGKAAFQDTVSEYAEPPEEPVDLEPE